MKSNNKNWYLRKPDGSEYGPITTSDMQRWSKQCRIVAGNGVSSDREEWIKVEDIPELEMEWIAHRLDGKEYGPFNIAATQELLDHKILTEDTTLTNKITHQSVTVEQVLNEEDLFSESDTNDQQNDEDDDILSEEALKEEEMYTAEQSQPSAQKQSTKATESSSVKPEVSEKSNPAPIVADTLTPKIEKLEAKLQKAKSHLSQARKDLKSSIQESTETIENLTEDRDNAKNALTAMQKKLEALKQTQAKASENNKARIAELEAQVEEISQKCQQAEAKLSRLESERGDAEQKSLQSVAELRKQTAFMKKNSATLQHELKKSRTIASRRGRQLVTIITILALGVCIMLLIGKPGCSKKQNVPEQKPDSPEITDDTPLSQRPYGDSANNIPTKPINSNVDKKNTPSSRPVTPSGNSSLKQSRAFPKIMIKGVKVIKSGNINTIRFDSGVFTKLTTPSKEAIVQIKEIADALRSHMSKFRIVVEGCTDNTPMRKTTTYDGNYALGLARAETIKKLLITKGNLPGTSITARYAGEKNAPYPNNTAANRKRNRTVVIKVINR